MLNPERGCKASQRMLPALQDVLSLVGEIKICSLLSPCADPSLSPSILVKVLCWTVLTKIDKASILTGRRLNV